MTEFEVLELNATIKNTKLIVSKMSCITSNIPCERCLFDAEHGCIMYASIGKESRRGELLQKIKLAESRIKVNSWKQIK